MRTLFVTMSFLLTECQQGKFGENCADQCGSCANNETCNHVNGTCPSGCDAHHFGDTCKESRLSSYYFVSFIVCIVLKDGKIGIFTRDVTFYCVI